MLYPQKWKVPKDILDDDAPPTDYEGTLLAQARDQYHAKLNPIQVRTLGRDAFELAMPRAYWLEQFFLSSQLIVIEPSEDSWQRVQSAMEHHEGHDYDMDILNKVFGASTSVIPHRRYDLLTGEFRHQIDQHEAYLGSPTERWNGRDAVKEAKFVHFSDWPLPKPWLNATEDQVARQQPSCRSLSEGELDCTDREMWLELRRDFSERRLRVCGKAYDNI
ncbi:hypothetical protein J4E83_005204 [Alternaria metachromatica]|uniref:uncharacterized protein n=1 Tax=Alternaria metachromatica TaxID=283354 RepID=UPI0020C4EFA7|nr:uncharacterized protein J4E83_005204 [Alternaria metachromatica]KAI4620842.1 hypothetical protein J4E83_005204 [Alternaria metachromatica]